MTSLPRRLVRGLQPIVPRRSSGGHVLAYHLVGGDSGLAVDVPRRRFESQMRALRGRAEPVSLEELWQRRALAAARPRVAVTFDDAFRNFVDVALPILEEHAIPVALFVPVGFVAGERESPFGRLWSGPPMDWSELASAASSEMVTVGSHSWSHADLRSLSEDELEEDLGRSRRCLEDRTEADVRTFCYPRGLWNRRVERSVGRTYSLAVVGGGRGVSADTPPLRLERTSIRHDMPAELDFLDRAVYLEERLADGMRRLRSQPAISGE